MLAKIGAMILYAIPIVGCFILVFVVVPGLIMTMYDKKLFKGKRHQDKS